MDNESGYMFRLVLAFPCPMNSDSVYMFWLVLAFP